MKTMTFNSSQIETITNGVLRELASRGVTVAAASLSPTPTASPRKLAADIGLSDKVVTEECLSAANAAGKTISIPAGAIITPSGHDYIRRHHVVIASRLGSSVTAATSGILIAIGNCSSAISAAATAQWELITAGCEFDAADTSIQQNSKPIVCAGGEPSVTACLLNRNADVRAAVVTQNTDIKLLTSTMNPQVICLDSSGWSFAAMLRLFRTLNAGDLTTPKAWKEVNHRSLKTKN